MKKVFFLIWLTLFALSSYAQHVFASSNVNLRSSPSTDSKVVYQVPQGTPIELNGCEDEWCEVTVSGHSGFIAKQYTVSAENYHAKEYRSSTSCWASELLYKF